MKKQIILIVSIVVALAIVFGVAIVCSDNNDTNNTTTPTESISGTTNETTGDETTTDMPESDINPDDSTEVPDDTTENETIDTTEPSVNLEHGEQDDEGRVYVDTDIVDIGDGKDIDTFFDLIEEHYGEYNPNIDYKFVADDNEYRISKESYGYDIRIRPSKLENVYTEEYYEYGEDKTNIGHVVQSYKDGKFSYILQERGDHSEELEYLENNVIVNTVTDNGVTTTQKYQSIGDKAYTQYYKDNEKEVTLTYDASGTMLIRYKSVNFKDGCTYDWVLDGNGYDPSNCVSVTITKNGSSKTYTGKDIPWGSPIDYPPKSAGLYE